jgi:hypothetical protein
MQDKKNISITYKILKTRFTRGSSQTITGLNKEDAKCWAAWVLSKGGTYTISKS